MRFHGIVLYTVFSAGVISALSADSAPKVLAEDLQSHVLYANSFNSADFMQECASGKLSPRNAGNRKIPFVKDGGILGGGISLIDNHLVLEDPAFSMKNPRTYFIWFKYTPKSTGFSLISNRGTNSKNKSNFIQIITRITKNGSGIVRLRPLTQRYYLPGNTSGTDVIADDFQASWPTDQWHHVAVTSDGKRILFYLDGKRVGELRLNTLLTNEANLKFLSFGTYDKASPVLFDELIVFDSVLPVDCIEEYVDTVRVIAKRNAIIHDLKMR
jgi:hypothetical protein